MTNQRRWWHALRRTPAVSAWPFVVVILTQMAVAGFSVYTLTATRTFISGESLWSKGQHEAIYFLSLYLDTENPQDLQSFKRTLAVPLAYRKGRQNLESTPANPAATQRAFVEGGTAAQDAPSAIWMFRNFRGFPYLEEAIARWKEADEYILELGRLGDEVEAEHPIRHAAELRARVKEIDAAITPRTVAFSRALTDGARLVERLLMVANFLLACVLAVLTTWRVGRVLTQRRQFEDALAWQASHDELTGIVNRRAFEERLCQTLTPVKGIEPAGCALMFIDLDQFKIINDTCGHAAGDAMLRRIGPPVQKILGPNDLVARLGGDEFGILMPATNMDDALAASEAVRAAVEHVDFLWNRRSFAVTASIGLVYDDSGTISPEEMMSKADMACLMAKEKGRIREMSWVQRIQHALNEDRFCLYAQEIVALGGADNAGLHLEVLLRMRDETGTLVAPSSFLPAAERFGLIKQVDRWVVRRTFQTLADRRMIADAAPIACCAINLSGATIGDDAFLGFLKEAFAEFRIPPCQICFEVTETTAIVNLDGARSFIGDLKAFGCTFALDDFGSGMSSFNYLKELPVDFLKIDGAFVKNLLTERPDRAMVEMINHVGHVMGKQIIAEFVETEELADALRDIGIDYAQGYGIAYPKPFDPRFEGLPKSVSLPTIIDRRRIA